MAIRLSTAMANSLLGDTAAVIAMYIGAVYEYSATGITDGAATFITDDIREGDRVTTQGSTTGANDTDYTITSLTETLLTLSPAPNNAEVFAAGTAAAIVRGQSISDMFRMCCIDIYTGGQPSSADAAETGTLLVRISDTAAAYTIGVQTNGLLWGTATLNVLAKAAAQTWSGTAVASGTAGWFRCYACIDGVTSTGADAAGASGYIRFDGTVSTSGADLNLPSINITAAGTVTVDTATFTIPLS